MRAMLLGLAAPIAAIAIPAAPAGAQFAADPGVSAGHGVTVHRDFRRGDRRRHRDHHGTVVVGDFHGDAWALYNNRSWEADSFNDWWHDRPDRAYPRWMQNNRNCDRLWWGGGVWRCTW